MLRFPCRDPSGCSKIKKHRRSVRVPYHDIVRTHVPVYDPASMYLAQRLQNRLYDRPRTHPRQLSPGFLNIRRQRNSVYVFHDDIYCAVRFYYVVNPDSIGNVFHLGSQSGLADRPLHSFCVYFRHGIVNRLYMLRFRVPMHNTFRKVLLDCNLPVQGKIYPQISDAESAASQHLPC